MAIFKAPRITTAQRLTLVLEASEIVYDESLKLMFSGDGITLGGVPIGYGVAKNIYNVTITNQMITDKQLSLPAIPLYPGQVTLEFFCGTQQINGIDFQVQNNEVNWNSLGLDGFIEEDDVVIIYY